MGVPTDIEIANWATLRPIHDIAERLGITDDELIPYGRYKAKVHIAAQAARLDRPNGKLVVVSSISIPDSAGRDI
jgi:formate--tetrahydrofolate ligase